MDKDIVLVTGGNGFIGSHVCVKLVEKGYFVIVVCRSKSSKNTQFNKYVKDGKIKLYNSNILDFDYSKIGNVDYIIHIAGKVSAFGEMSDFMQINYNGTKKVLEFAKSQKKLKCFSYLSSTAVYGYRGYVNLKEEDEKKPFNNPYSISKLKTENLVQNFANANKFDFVIIRPGNVFGEYDYTSSYEIYSRIKKQKMSICANGRYKSCFVYVGNLANAIIQTTIEKSCHNTDYNVTDGYNETLKQYLTMVAKEFGVKDKFLNFPAPLAKFVASFVEFIYKLFRIKKSPLITKFSIWQNCADYNFSIDKLLKTGYKIETDFKTAIKKTVNWFNTIKK